MLDELTKKYEGRFQVIHLLEKDENNIAEIEGRPSPGIVSSLVGDKGLTDGEFYVCGPQPMMDVVKQGLELAGVPNDNIRIESFEAGKTSPKEIIAEENGQGSEVTILLDGEEFVISVPKDQPILETGLDAGLDMPYSCQSGLCTACRGKCLEGEITTDEVEGLSEEELDEGYRLLCIGKPAADKIKVEIG